jgi:hypothetical protein
MSTPEADNSYSHFLTTVRTIHFNLNNIHTTAVRKAGGMT